MVLFAKLINFCIIFSEIKIYGTEILFLRTKLAVLFMARNKVNPVIWLSTNLKLPCATLL
jgi:hypothetical protein